jgi:hypothetical protein
VQASFSDSRSRDFTKFYEIFHFFLIPTVLDIRDRCSGLRPNDVCGEMGVFVAPLEWDIVKILFVQVHVVSGGRAGVSAGGLALAWGRTPLADVAAPA